MSHLCASMFSEYTPFTQEQVARTAALLFQDFAVTCVHGGHDLCMTTWGKFRAVYKPNTTEELSPLVFVRFKENKTLLREASQRLCDLVFDAVSYSPFFERLDTAGYKTRRVRILYLSPTHACKPLNSLSLPRMHTQSRRGMFRLVEVRFSCCMCCTGTSAP